MRLERRDLVGLVFALAAASLCARLGVWQIRRLGERRAQNAATQAARERPPLDLTATLTPDVAWGRRLRARGVYDYAHEQVWPGRTFQGVPGVALITPLRLEDGAAVLVDRGWAPSADAYHLDERLYREPDTADVLGIGMRAPRARGDVDPAKLGDSLTYPLLPVVVQLLPPPTAAYRPLPPATAPDRPLPPGLLRWPLPALTDGPHLAYAIQWFSFAVIIVVGSAALFRKRASLREALPLGQIVGRPPPG
ncbi:MAG TPA: SURF1 family protein [Gemmatimonadales bacterium]|nr:SURF1 family protein [Gemmatimonadales bacterium]